MKTRRSTHNCGMVGTPHTHVIREVTDFREARFGDVFARPHFHHDLRVMFIAYGTNQYGEGWSGVEIAGPDEGKAETDYVQDGWEKVE